MKSKNKFTHSFFTLLIGGLIVFVLGISTGYFYRSSLGVGTLQQSEIKNQLQPAISYDLSFKVGDHIVVDNNLREVNFCGTKHKVKQLMVDGVDVVQRIAQLATERLIQSDLQRGFLGGEIVTTTKEQIASNICHNVNRNGSTQLLTLELGEKFVYAERKLYPDRDFYPFSIGGNLFYVSVPSENLYFDDPFDGLIRGPIGKLKS